MINKILVCCGAGVATSTVVAIELEEALNERGIKVKCEHCKVMEVAGLADGYNLLVSNVRMEYDLPIPVIMGLPFITGIGKEKALQAIIDELNVIKHDE
jgi:PTS system galactitol-specific IIB component